MLVISSSLISSHILQGCFTGKCQWSNPEGKIGRAPSQYKDGLTRYRILIVKMKRSLDRVIFVMEISILVRRRLYVGTVPLFGNTTRATKDNKKQMQVHVSSKILQNKARQIIKTTLLERLGISNRRVNRLFCHPIDYTKNNGNI